MEKIGIDIGGTSIKAGIVINNKLVKSIKINTPKQKKEIINQIYFIIDNFKTKKTKFIGIGMPGPFKDIENGIAYKQNNINLDNVNLKKLIEDKYKIKVKINNDANCFALAQSIFGKGKEHNNVIGITLGTGLGAGFVINKKIYSGRGNALELGLNIIDLSTLNIIEDYLGKDNIILSSNEYNLNITQPLQAYELALKGDKKAIKLWKDYGTILGLVLSNVIKNFDPDVIVIGGNISNSWKFFSKEMKLIVNQFTNKPCPIYQSTIKEPGIIGATLLSL